MRICVLRVCPVSIEKVSTPSQYSGFLDESRILTWKVTGLVSMSVWGSKTAHSAVSAFFATCHLSLLSAGYCPISPGETPGQLSSWAFSVGFRETFQMAEVAKSLTSG